MILQGVGLPQTADDDAGWDACPIEQVVAQGDDCLDEVHFQHVSADLAFDAGVEERAERKHDCHSAGAGGHGLDHVLDPGEVAALVLWDTRKCPTPWIALPDLAPPLLEREGGIGDDQVEGRQAARARVGEDGVAERVATLDDEVLDAVQQQVHAGHGGRGQVSFLAEELAEECSRVAARLTHILHGRQQHAAGAAGRVVHGLALARVEDVHHQPHDAAGGVELPCLLVGRVSELLDQVLVRVAHHVVGDLPVAQQERGEMLDEVLEQLVRQPLLVGPLGVTEHAIEVLLVGSLDAPHRVLEGLADVPSPLADIVPVGSVGDLKPVFVLEVLSIRRHGHRMLLVPDVADPLEEEQRQDVALPVGAVDGAPAEDVGGLPEMRLERRQGQALPSTTGAAHRRSPILLAAASFCLAIQASMSSFWNRQIPPTLKPGRSPRFTIRYTVFGSTFRYSATS